MDNTMSIEDFLRSRDLPEETLLHFKEEKIDCGIILVMPEDDLKKVIPKYGDRAALRDFCTKSTSSTKLSLIQKLKEKLESKNGKRKETEGNSSFESKKKLWRKKSRMIEVGWVCECQKEKRFRQIRTKAGGGTRRISVDKNIKCADILPKAIDLFFPEGKSTQGPRDFFEFELWDYKSHKFNLELTIQEMYELSALTTLRFYLSTSYKEGINIQENNDANYIPDTLTSHGLDETSQGLDDTTNVRHSERLVNPNRNTTNIIETAMECLHSDHEVDHNTNDSEVRLLVFENSTNIYEIPDDFSEGIFTPQLEELQSLNDITPEKTTVIILHRGNVFSDLLEAFKKDGIERNRLQIEMILPNGEKEVAEDMGGVYRDALSEFWSSFYEKCTTGINAKIPYLRHDYKTVEWETIAKILAKGWTEQKYFPIKLSLVFVKSCLLDDMDVNNDDLLSDFKRYVCDYERDLIELALRDFNNVDHDELLDFLSNLDSKWMPTKENINKLLTDIAFKELIQKPSFVAKCFMKYSYQLPTIVELTKIYKEFEPTAKNIIENLEIRQTEITEDMTKVYSFLKKFIKESDATTRGYFVRFCTGSDLVNFKIGVSFIKMEGFTRSPLAHTCSCLLELPTTYDNYVEFRSEFSMILSSNIWIMDMV